MTTHQPEKVVSSSSAAVRARLQLLDERLARLRATRERLSARASRTERKRDTRRKIVVGGTVLDQAKAIRDIDTEIGRLEAVRDSILRDGLPEERAPEQRDYSHSSGPGRSDDYSWGR